MRTRNHNTSSTSGSFVPRASILITREVASCRVSCLTNKPSLNLLPEPKPNFINRKVRGGWTRHTASPKIISTCAISIFQISKACNVVSYLLQSISKNTYGIIISLLWLIYVYWQNDGLLKKMARCIVSHTASLGRFLLSYILHLFEHVSANSFLLLSKYCQNKMPV